MDRIVSNIKRYLIDNDIKASQAESAIGVSNGTLSKALSKGTSIKTDTLEKFLNTYKDFWIRENMGVDYINEKTNVYKLRTDKNHEHQTIPLYNLEATAGLVDLFLNAGNQTPIDTISIPNLPKCDGAIFVTGDSMYPLLKSGDIICYKQIFDFNNEIFWGEMYLISVEVAEEEFVSVKYIQKSDKGDDYVKLVSQNQHHQPKDVLIEKVRALALVKASIRINSMR